MTTIDTYREDIFVAAARKELEYIIKATYSNLVYSLYEPLYSLNTLVLLLNSIFVKTSFDALVLISLLMTSGQNLLRSPKAAFLRAYQAKTKLSELSNLLDIARVYARLLENMQIVDCEFSIWLLLVTKYGYSVNWPKKSPAYGHLVAYRRH